MAVTHIVQFQFKQAVKSEQIQELVTRMFALQKTCLHPRTGQPYIQSFTGGLDNSVQGLQDDFTHVFVIEFASKEDKDYYALSDPVHAEFVHWSDSVAQKVQAIDFTDGVFSR